MFILNMCDNRIGVSICFSAILSAMCVFAIANVYKFRFSNGIWSIGTRD